MKFFDVTATDLTEVLELNEASVPHVSSISAAEMRWFAEHAHYFRVVRHGASLAGFLIGLRPGLAYQSLNYGWFCDRYSDFGYVDRVAVAPNTRRLGVGSRLYEDFATTLEGEVEVMTCEVNLRPANESSMRYHEHLGFVQVGSQETEGGEKEVALLEKRL
jgi:predicted GNAT superfamily acetyltransferase